MQSDTDSTEEPPDSNNVIDICSSHRSGYNNNKPETNQQIKSWRSNGIVNKISHAGQQSQEQQPVSTNSRNNSIIVNAKSLELSSHYDSTNNLRAERRSQNDGNEGRQNNSNTNFNNINNIGRHGISEKSKSTVQLAGFSDDLRISKILRRLLSENNPHRAQELCQKLELAVRSPINSAYICRSFDFLLDSMQTLLKQCPEEILQQASVILGLIGYINHNDFPIYKNCITKCYQSCKELQKYIMLALRTTIKADAANLDLMVYSERMLIVLKDYLENAEKAEDFIAVSETMAAFAKNYTRSFENHFTDVVDIIVGWHLEAEQTQALKQHCSTVLQHFSSYFLKALNFTLGLLGQFLEDLLVVGEELKMENSSLQSKEKAEIRVGAFVGAFNSICKALTTKKQLIIWSAGRQIIDETFMVILELFIKTLSAGLSSEDTVLQINDFLYLLFSHGYKRRPQEKIQELIMLQLGQVPKYTRQQTSSLLCLILCIIRQQRTYLPCAIVTILFEPNVKSSLCVLHFSNDAKLYRLLLAIYHEVLMIKNVPLLQEAYKYMLMDIIKHMEMLEICENNQQLQAATKLNFYLSALSALATQTSSIIGMYALNPSILELLINNFRASYMPLWCKHEMLHGALLQLLVIHCKKNHNFRTSSRVLQSVTEEVNNSRTADHFGLILQFLADIFSQSHLLAIENLILLLDWLQALLVEFEQHILVLVTKQQFQDICLALAQTSLVAALPCAKCMQILLKNGALNILPYILHNWFLIIVQHLDSSNAQVQSSYSMLLDYIPLQILLMDNVYTAHRVARLNGLQHWYKATMLFAPLQARYMKPFLETLEDSNVMEIKLYKEFDKMFQTSWTLQFRDKGMQYEQEVNKSCWLLISWLQHEVARICVRNKLRTPLGKPQDTFLGIEAIIMKYARLLNKDDTAKKPSTFHEKICTQAKIRLLLGFLDCLEKQIYNAAEGTAFSLLPVEKPAKTFFRLNINTCNSWFQRIRFGVNLLASKCLQPHIVIHYAQCMLIKEQQPTESTIIALVNALLACQEADTLHGLYAWLKSRTGQRYVWLQHAAEQAAGRHELALEGYMLMLQDKHTKLSLQVQEFLQNQLLACYYHSGQWTHMSKILSENGSWSNLPNYRNQAHLKTLDALIFGPKVAYEEQLLLLGACESSCQALLTLTEWPDAVNVSEMAELSYMETIKHLEDTCMLHVLQHNRSKQAVVEDIIPAVRQALRENLRYEHTQEIGNLLLLNKVTHALTHENVRIDSNYFNCVPIGKEISSNLLTKSLIWTQLFNVAAREKGVPVQTPCRHFLDLAETARLDGNTNYCAALLRRCLQMKGYSLNLPEFSAALHNSNFLLNLADGELLRTCSELTQCMWANSNSQMEAINLSAAICNQMVEHMVMMPQLKQSAQMLLSLAEWITPRVGVSNINNLDAINSLPLQRLLNNLPEVKVSDLHISIPLAEKAVGKLLNASILQHNDAGEAWFAFGNWCYRWGKKLVEANNNSGEGTRRGKLSDNEMMAIRAVLGEDVDPQTLQQLTEALENLQLHDGLEDIETSEISTMEIIESELRKIEVLSQRPVEQINSIIEIWRNAHKSVFAYYELATKSYFKYLSLESGCNLNDASFVTTTLRILRLVVKHAIGLQDTLEVGLNFTPLRPWRAIIPQLFSRLNHHEPYVRKSVAELLCRLALDRPHLVIFPAVVGALQELRHAENEDTNRQLSNCFGTLVNTLQIQSPDAVLHVQLLVKELKRVALLWEEYWMNSLAQLYAEYTPLFNAFDLEVKKYGEKQLERLNAKYTLLMQYVLSDFQKIANGTNKTCETNYERNFQDKFKNLISNSMIALQKPLNLAKPNEHWLTIKQLYNVFQQRAIRSTSSTFKVQDLSPVLAAMQNTAISMPGVDTFEREPIYIRAVENSVHVLPTKTRPKKLVFLGSDGRKYTYLFKGLEDLHLDERIMQVLSIANAMMARATTYSMSKDVSGFRAQHYSVIPLGPQSGLISWVDGLIPLFAIYKKWQQREALLKQQQKERPNQTNQSIQQQNNLPAPTRPSEIFYNKLTPLLAEQNIKITDSRKQWPLPILRRVLKELSEETPRDLLAKELWCFANNTSDWRKSVRCYTKSVAVMSVIGYVIGLGDRHLDNVLIRLSTGEIVHIDYNVCFEKGKTLRVPEKVPFRMTPNVEEALGLTGIEGAFRLGCEHVLKTLRKERETLLTLLEAFVYDPLVDWTVGDDGSATATRTTSAHAAAQAILALNDTASLMAGDKEPDVVKSHETMSRKDDWQLTRQNIHMRLNELKPYWTKYKNEVSSKLNKINNDIEELLRKREDITISERQRGNISKELALIHELEALGTARGSHGLNTITQRYVVYKQSANAFNNLKKRVQQFQQEYELMLKIYFDCVLRASTTAGDLVSLQVQLLQQGSNMPIKELKDLQAALEPYGHKQLYELYEFARKEMENTLVQQTRNALNCVEYLIKYANIIKYYPRKQLQQHRCVKYAQWYRKLFDEEQEPTALRQELELCIELENQPAEEQKRTAALNYVEGMTKRWNSLNYDLHNEIIELRELEQKSNDPNLDVCINDLQSFYCINMQVHKPALEVACCQLLAKTNEAFQQYEQNIFKKHENILLDQQLNYTHMVLTMCANVYPANIDTPQHLALKALIAALTAVCNFKRTLEVLVPEILLQLYIQSDTNSKHNSILCSMCVTPKNPEEWLRNKDFDAYPEFIEFLESLYAQFNEVEIHITELQRMEREVLNSASLSAYTQFLCNKKSLWSLQDLRTEVIAKIFYATRDAAQALNTNDSSRVYEVSDICAPLIHYVYQIQGTYLLGLTSLFCHEIIPNYVKEMQESMLDDTIMASAVKYCQNLVIALQQKEAVKSQQAVVFQNSKWVEHYTLVSSAHYWLNENLLDGMQLQHQFTHIVHRDNLLSNVQANCQSLEVWKQTIDKIGDDIEKHTAAVLHLYEVDLQLPPLKALYEDVTQQRQRTQMQQQTCNQLIDCANAMLRFEMLKSGSNSLAETDMLLITLLQQWQGAYATWRQSGAAITPVELDIVQLLDPEGKVDQCWINNITGLLDDLSYNVQRQLGVMEREEQMQEEALQAEAMQLQVLIEASIRVDTRHLLKTIVKWDKHPRYSTCEMLPLVARARELQHKLKGFYNKLAEMQLKLSARDYTESGLLHLTECSRELLCSIEDRYNDLMQIVQRTLSNVLSCSPTISGEGQLNSDNIDLTGNPVEKDKKVNHKGQQQKRNAYAVSVWKRIRMKLEGRDPDPNRRSTVNEQVDYIIREAINPDNLAVLYEGWTPWV